VRRENAFSREAGLNVRRAALVFALAFAALAPSACGGAGGDGGDVGAGRASSECADCHMSDFRAATHPMHVGVRPTKCAVCHASYSWHPSRIEHEFPLTGAHAGAACFDCHKGTPTVFDGTPKDCVGCHRSDFDRSTYPGHSQFPLTCESCHSTSAWKPPLPTFVAHAPDEEPAAGRPTKSKKSAASPMVAPPRPKPVPTTALPPSTATTPASTGTRPDNVSGASHRR
jgi:hypothetical protein